MPQRLWPSALKSACFCCTGLPLTTKGFFFYGTTPKWIIPISSDDQTRVLHQEELAEQSLETGSVCQILLQRNHSHQCWQELPLNGLVGMLNWMKHLVAVQKGDVNTEFGADRKKDMSWRVRSNRMTGYEHKLEHEKFQINVRFNFFLPWRL